MRETEGFGEVDGRAGSSSGRQGFVFISRRLPREATSLLEGAGHEVRLHDSVRAPEREQLLAAIAGSAGVITLLSDTVDDEFLDRAGPGLKIVANYAVGYDNVDLGACRKRGVAVANTPDVLTNATADQALMLMLAVARRVRAGHAIVASGEWEGWHPLQLLGRDVSGATLGIVGMGRIGTAVARRANGFGMKVIYHNRRRQEGVERELGAAYRASLADLLAESDIVSLHAPLTAETRHLLNEESLRQMKPNAILVNTARGALVDERALVDALAQGRLWGAGLDVFEAEPKIAPGLAELDNVVLAPHLGSATESTRREMARLCAEAVVDVLAGRTPANLVVPPG